MPYPFSCSHPQKASLPSPQSSHVFWPRIASRALFEIEPLSAKLSGRRAPSGPVGTMSTSLNRLRISVGKHASMRYWSGVPRPVNGPGAGTPFTFGGFCASSPGAAASGPFVRASHPLCDLGAIEAAGYAARMLSREGEVDGAGAGDCAPAGNARSAIAHAMHRRRVGTTAQFIHFRLVFAVAFIFIPRHPAF